jgi:hypothetical protein
MVCIGGIWKGIYRDFLLLIDMKQESVEEECTEYQFIKGMESYASSLVEEGCS